MSKTNRKLILIVVLTLLISVPVTTLAGQVNLEDLKVKSVKLTGMNWKVRLSIDISFSGGGGNNSSKEDSRGSYNHLQVNYYEDGNSGSHDFQYIDPRPLNPNRNYDDFEIMFHLPSSYRGESTIEVCEIPQDQDSCCTSWEGWIPRRPEIISSGGFDFPQGTDPNDEGLYSSEIWSIGISTTDQTSLTIIGSDLPIEVMAGGTELPTWWRCWNEKADNDGNLEATEKVDTGWKKVEKPMTEKRIKEITLQPGWSGEINLQLRIERSGLKDPAGNYQGDMGMFIDQ